MQPDGIIHNAKIATNGVPSFVEAVAIKDGKISAVGRSDEILRQRGPATQVIDGKGRTAIPGLNDSMIRTCIQSEVTSTTTWNCVGTACLLWLMLSVCSKSKLPERPRPSGCEW